MPTPRTLVLAAAALAAAVSFASGRPAQSETVKCIVSGKDVEVTDKTPSVSVNGQKSYFCCMNCPKAFAKEPEKYVKTAGNCPMNKAGAAKIGKESRVILNNNLFYFCCANCPKAFAADPSKGAKELTDAVTKKPFAPKTDSARSTHEGQLYVFATPENKAEFDKEPAKYAVIYAK